MTTKVYWKALRLVLATVKRYIQKWDTQLHISLTEDQYNCVLAVLEAVITCLNALPENTPIE